MRTNYLRHLEKPNIIDIQWCQHVGGSGVARVTGARGQS